MPWKEHTAMSLRSEFVAFARAPDANISELCRRFGISRKTGYKWLQRTGLGLSVEDHSRRPVSSPGRTPAGVEAHIVALRQRYPFYGGRKIRQLLIREHVERPPAASTITAILDRNGLLSPERRRTRNWQRFEAPVPNALWQMDFKGHFGLSEGRCHPLTVLDDHSRFCLGLAACPDEQGVTVKEQLIPIFERYGLPERILADNGPPWGSSGQGEHTRFSAWLMRLGITVSHGRRCIPRLRAKMNGSTERSSWRWSANGRCGTTTRRYSAPSTTTGPCTTSSGRTKRWPMRSLARATHPAPGPIRVGCRRLSTTPSLRSAVSTSAAGSSSRESGITSARPSPANP